MTMQDGCQGDAAGDILPEMNDLKPGARSGGPLAFILAAVLFVGLGIVFWLDQEAPVVEVPPAPGAIAPPPPVAPAPPQTPPLAAPAFFKCLQDARVVYQDHPCASPALPATGGTFSIIAPTPVPSVRPGSDTDGPHAVAIVPRRKDEEGAECATLRAGVRQVDARARQASSDALTRQRHWLRLRMTESNCREFD